MSVLYVQERTAEKLRTIILSNHTLCGFSLFTKHVLHTFTRTNYHGSPNEIQPITHNNTLNKDTHNSTYHTCNWLSNCQFICYICIDLTVVFSMQNLICALWPIMYQWTWECSEAEACVLSFIYLQIAWQNNRNTKKQEAHGPHGSPENQFQTINTFAHDKILPQCWLKEKKILSFLWKLFWNGPYSFKVKFPSPKDASQVLSFVLEKTIF